MSSDEPSLLTNWFKSLRKKLVTVRMSWSKPKSEPSEVEIEAVVEELRKDKDVYQKTALLHLRSPVSAWLTVC